MDNPQTNGQNQPLNDPQPPNETTAKTELARLKEKFLPGIRITLLCSLIMYLAMFVVGCLAVHKCPVEPNIPLFLVATGGIGLFSKFISYLRDRILEHFQVKYVESSLYTVETVFLVLGSYWVYKVYAPSYDPKDGKLYCQKTAYMFAFIYLTVLYSIVLAILAGFSMFLICICCVKLCGKEDREEETGVAANQQNPA